MTYTFDDSGKLKAMTAAELAEADKDSSVIVRNKGVLKDNSPYWAYIAVKPSKYLEFLEVTQKHHTIKLNDYGVLLKYGFEQDVPSSIKEEMKQLYGCDEHYMEHLSRSVKEAQRIFIKEQENRRISDIISILKKKSDSH